MPVFSCWAAARQVHADAGYIGVEKRPGIAAWERKMDWQIARKRGRIKPMAEGAEKETFKAIGKAKAAVRAFGEHPFHIRKNIFRHRKVRHRGPATNGHQLYTPLGLANVVIGARAHAVKNHATNRLKRWNRRPAAAPKPERPRQPNRPATIFRRLGSFPHQKSKFKNRALFSISG